jgi:hypothetical protein
MDILRKNTIPVFQIVPRKDLNLSDIFRIELHDENTKASQNILCTITFLANENYNLTLATFPLGKLGAKLSYALFNNGTNELVLLGKLIIVSETQSIQDYTNKTNNNFYA